MLNLIEPMRNTMKKLWMITLGWLLISGGSAFAGFNDNGDGDHHRYGYRARLGAGDQRSHDMGRSTEPL